MRAAWMPGGLALVLLWAGSAHTEPSTQTILLPEVLVRSGPSPEFYPTGKLHQGDKVRVLREVTTGWLAIEPPLGSFSWIDKRFVEQTGANTAVVSAPEAPILVGSCHVNAKPSVSRISVKKGTQLTVYGRTIQTWEGAWVSIFPVPAEVRYIPAEAIRPSSAPTQYAAAAPEPIKASTSASGFDASRPTSPALAPVPIANANPSVSISPGAPSRLWLQAEEAERAGNLVRAKELFEELAQQVKSTDYDLCLRCLNRVQALQDRRPTGFTASPAGLPAPANPSTAVAPNRLVPTPTGSRALSPAPQALSEYCYVRDSGYTAKLSPPVPSAPSPPAPSGQWSDPGRLRKTAMILDGRPLFCLQPLDPNKRHLYVTAGPNLNLEPYIERTVYLYGPMVYRGELRTNHVTALQVSPVR